MKIKPHRGACLLLAVAAFCTMGVNLPDSNAADSTSIFFSEGFEDDDLARRGWYDGNRFRIAGDAFAGRGCLEYEWTAGATQGGGSSGVRRLFEPTDEVAIRFYLKFSKGWAWSGKNWHPHLTHFMTTENSKFHGPAGSHLTLYIEPVGGRLRLATQDTQNATMPHGLTQGPIKGRFNGMLYDSAEVLFNDDRWHCVEAYFKLNTLDLAHDRPNADGIVRGWFDGRLVVDRTDVVLRSTDFPNMKFNQFLMTPYFGPGLLPHPQRLWFDELAVGRKRIGPLTSSEGDRRRAVQPFPELAVPATCGMQLKGAYSTPADLDQIRALGVQVVRRGFHWESIEKSKGIYDFSAHDGVMREIRARGLRVIGVAAFANKLYGPVREAEGRQAYARYAAALAGHYKADRVIWELWNEPNTMTFWGRHGGKGNSEPYAEEYVALVNETVPAMRRADPDCVIAGGSVSCLWSESYKWMDFCFAKGILRSGIDAWSVHPYSPNLPEDYEAAYGKVRDMMQQHGASRDFIMLNTERGFPIKRAEGHAGGDEAMQREYQAWHLVRQSLVDLMCGMRTTVWYEWKNAREGFGIFDDNKESPAFRAYQVMIGQLRGCRLEQRIETAAARDYVLVFRSEQGERKLVAWTAPPPGGTPDQLKPHALEVTVERDGPHKLVQLDGKSTNVTARDRRVTLALTGAPQFLSD